MKKEDIDRYRLILIFKLIIIPIPTPQNVRTCLIIAIIHTYVRIHTCAYHF